MQAATTAQLVPPSPPLFDETRLAVSGFLARYSGTTRIGYATDLRAWFSWCAETKLEIFGVRRAHIELFARWMEEERHLARATIGRRLSTVVGFYRFAVVDGYITESPAEHVRRPKIDTESTTLGSRPHGAGRLRGPGRRRWPGRSCPGLPARATRPAGLRGVLNQHRAPEHRARTSDRGQGGQGRRHTAATPRWPGDRPGYRRADERVGAAVPFRTALDRHGATRIVRRVAKKAGISKRISPHSLRHSFITAALDAGVPLRDVQIAARHADPRTTTRYDRAATTWTGMPATSFPHS